MGIVGKLKSRALCKYMQAQARRDDEIECLISFSSVILTRSNHRLCTCTCSAFDMLGIEEQCATCNLPCVKKCYFPHAGDVSTEHLRSSSVSNVIKAVKAVTAFFYSSLIGASYKRHRAEETESEAKCRRNESEANCRRNEILIFLSYTRLGLRSPIVKRNNNRR